MNSSPHSETSDGHYQVVALKYRPQSFDDLIGQSHIATALSNAINQARVGHAYLFTGARGVGKTSSARIFAKCLNCENGPTTTPCGECDICQTISSGEDVDVLEIDGASNRGIDEIRSLRSNAAIRPSRSRNKIYIIDEVHMLTTQAFNALLKTLEEPPGHVKFIFCTTDPQKIPITVLSRCQRFDFSPVQTNEIAASLREIAKNEGVEAREEALALLARRANGSMRDSQSLLEQLFSFCDGEITVEHVHQLLGTADIGRIGEIAGAMVAHDATLTLNLIHQASLEGVNAGQLANQLLGYFRDVMAVKVNCGLDTLLTCTASDMDSLTAMCEQLGLETILNIVQVLDSAVVKMQSSLHARTLVEVAAIRICNLENLDSIADLVRQLAEATGPGGAAVKRPVPTTRSVELKKVTTTPAVKKNEITEPVKQVSETSHTAHRISAKSARQVMASETKVSTVAATSMTSGDSPPAAGSRLATATAKKPARELAALKTSTMVAPMGGQPAVVSRKSEIESERLDKEASVAVANKSVTSSPSELKKIWAEMIAALSDLTSDMAAKYESLEWASEDCIAAALADAYYVRECNKSERNSKVAATLSELLRRQVRVEFRLAKNVGPVEEEVPQLSRAQQMRKLQEIEFVKQTMSVFDAEVVGFFEPRKK